MIVLTSPVLKYINEFATETKARKYFYHLTVPYVWHYTRIHSMWLIQYLPPDPQHHNCQRKEKTFQAYSLRDEDSSECYSTSSSCRQTPAPPFFGSLELVFFLWLFFPAQQHGLGAGSEYGGLPSYCHLALTSSSLLPPLMPTFPPSLGTAYIHHSLHVLQHVGSKNF